MFFLRGFRFGLTLLSSAATAAATRTRVNDIARARLLPRDRRLRRTRCFDGEQRQHHVSGGGGGGGRGCGGACAAADVQTGH